MSWRWSRRGRDHDDWCFALGDNESVQIRADVTNWINMDVPSKCSEGAQREDEQEGRYIEVNSEE